MVSFRMRMQYLACSLRKMVSYITPCTDCNQRIRVIEIQSLRDITGDSIKYLKEEQYALM